MSLTEKDYPYTPYPPFKESDWRLIVGNTAGERDQQKARQLVSDATADHPEKHERHDHPWCSECWHRFEHAQRASEGFEPLQDPSAIANGIVESGIPALSKSHMDRLKAMFDAGWYPVGTPEDQLEEFKEFAGVDAKTIWAWLEYLNVLDNRTSLDTDAQTVPISRAARYLLIHGRPPKDDWEPDTSTSHDEEFLDRDELNNLPTPEPLIETVLPRHAYGILRGRDHSFKSFVALDWALCLATGRPWQGNRVERVRVLYIAGEGAYGLAGRVNAWEEATGTAVPPDAFTVRRSALSLFKPNSSFSHLLEWIEEGEYGLVIVDTLRRVSGSADGNGSDMGAVVDNLDRIKRATLNGAVLAVAHTDKGDTDSRGYSGIEDDADVVWHAKREEMTLALTNTKQKDGPDGQTIHLKARSVGGSLVLESGFELVATTTESQIKILDTLRMIFPEGAFSSQLHEASGLPKTTYYRALGDLKRDGHVVNLGSPTRPFFKLEPVEESQQVPREETGPDLHLSHESHDVPALPVVVPRVPPPLGVGLGTTDRDNDKESA